MPTPAKPTERKRAAGNPGKRHLPEPTATVAALTEPPEPPDSLGDRGRQAWADLWQQGRQWFAATDALALSMLCHAVDEQDAIRALLRADPGDFHARTALRALNAEILKLASSCGLTPADRSRLGFAEVRRASKLADLKARMADSEVLAAEVAQPGS